MSTGRYPRLRLTNPDGNAMLFKPEVVEVLPDRRKRITRRWLVKAEDVTPEQIKDLVFDEWGTLDGTPDLEGRYEVDPAPNSYEDARLIQQRVTRIENSTQHTVTKVYEQITEVPSEVDEPLITKGEDSRLTIVRTFAVLNSAPDNVKFPPLGSPDPQPDPNDPALKRFPNAVLVGIRVDETKVVTIMQYTYVETTGEIADVDDYVTGPFIQQIDGTFRREDPNEPGDPEGDPTLILNEPAREYTWRYVVNLLTDPTQDIHDDNWLEWNTLGPTRQPTPPATGPRNTYLVSQRVTAQTDTVAVIDRTFVELPATTVTFTERRMLIPGHLQQIGSTGPSGGGVTVTNAREPSVANKRIRVKDTYYLKPNLPSPLAPEVQNYEWLKAEVKTYALGENASGVGTNFSVDLLTTPALVDAREQGFPNILGDFGIGTSPGGGGFTRRFVRNGIYYGENWRGTTSPIDVPPAGTLSLIDRQTQPWRGMIYRVREFYVDYLGDE